MLGVILHWEYYSGEKHSVLSKIVYNQNTVKKNLEF